MSVFKRRVVSFVDALFWIRLRRSCEKKFVCLFVLYHSRASRASLGFILRSYMLASIAFIMGALDHHQVYVNLFCLLVYALDPPDHNMHVSTIFQPHENKTHNKTRYPAVDENLSSNVFQNIGKQNERTNRTARRQLLVSFLLP